MLSFRVPSLSNRAPSLSKGIWVLSYRRGALTRVLYIYCRLPMMRGRERHSGKALKVKGRGKKSLKYKACSKTLQAKIMKKLRFTKYRSFLMWFSSCSDDYFGFMNITIFHFTTHLSYRFITIFHFFPNSQLYFDNSHVYLK